MKIISTATATPTRATPKAHRPTPLADLKKKCRRDGAQPYSGAVAAATAGTTTVEVMAPGVVATRLGETGKMVGVAATTIAAAVATVAKAREQRRVLVVAQGAAKGANRPEPIGAAATAREEAPEDGGTAHEGLQGKQKYKSTGDLGTCAGSSRRSAVEHAS